MGSTAGDSLTADVRVLGSNFDMVTCTGAGVQVIPADRSRVYLPLATKQYSAGW